MCSTKWKSWFKHLIIFQESLTYDKVSAILETSLPNCLQNSVPNMVAPTKIVIVLTNSHDPKLSNNVAHQRSKYEEFFWKLLLKPQKNTKWSNLRDKVFYRITLWKYSNHLNFWQSFFRVLYLYHIVLKLKRSHKDFGKCFFGQPKIRKIHLSDAIQNFHMFYLYK